MEEQVLDFEITENIDILFHSKIILYGTASQAEKLYPLVQKAELNIVGCCDGSKEKIGKFFHDYCIESFSDVVNRLKMEDVIVLICSTFVQEIMEDCRKVYDKNIRFLTPYGLQIAFVLNRKNPNIKIEFKRWYNRQYGLWFDIQKRYS